MRLERRCIWLAGLALLFSATAAMANGDEAGLEGNNTVPILAMFGGFNSCPSLLTGDIHETNMGIATNRLKSRIRTETKAPRSEYVVSCFSKSNNRVRFVTSYDDGADHWLGDVDSVVAEITTLASRHPDHRVYLTGHSYGGWLAMYVVENLPAWVKVSVLMTLDPISVQDCGPTTFLRSYMNSAWQVNPAPGCTQAPSDLSSVAIRQRVTKWFNYYQASYPLLHSGYIGYADSNDMLHFDTPFLLEYKAHTWVEEDPRVWIRFNREVLFDLAI